MKKKKKTVKSESGYDKVEFNVEKSLKAREVLRRKMPTSVTLSPALVNELKIWAEKKGIPYQVLMRSFIIEGLERMKKQSE